MKKSQMKSGKVPAKQKAPAKAKRKDTGAVAVWAVDAFERDQERIEAAHRLVDFFAKSFRWSIQPISVIGPMDVNWPIELKAPFKNNIAQVARDSLSPAFAEIESDAAILEPRVLVQPITSLTASVDALVESAQKSKAQFIAVSTHGRRGLQHLRLGSFAETLIASSRIPILTLNPKAAVPEEIKTILVPTDFSSTSRRVFVRMVEWAKALAQASGIQPKIVLLHRLENPAPALFYGGGEIAVDGQLLRQMMEDAEAARKRQAGQWEKLAQGEDVPCQTILSKDGRDLAEMILEASRELDADLVAMATYRGTIGQGLLGSVARDVLLQAPCPVVIVHR